MVPIALLAIIVICLVVQFVSPYYLGLYIFNMLETIALLEGYKTFVSSRVSTPLEQRLFILDVLSIHARNAVFGLSFCNCYLVPANGEEK
jgi:hypothetical protein